LINEENDLNITRQSVYLYEREACRANLVKKRTRIMGNNKKKTRNKPKWVYHYDKEYVKINKEVYVRLSLIDAHTRINNQ